MTLVWLILAIVLIGAEILSGEFVLVMLGVAALGAAGAAALGADLIVSVIVFGLASVGLIWLARPALKRRMLVATHTKSNVEALPGSRAVALSTINDQEGTVRIGGDVWTARSLDHTVIEPGTYVTVVEISGATAVVISE